jgi:hypothetical protein
MDPQQETPTPFQPAPAPAPAPVPTPAPAAPFAPQQPMPTYAPATAPAATNTNPGKGLGIAGFILAFFVPVVGLPLSIVGYRKSRKNGYKNGLALAGIILNSVAIVFGALVLMLITTVAYNGVSTKAKTVSAETAGREVLKYSYLYGSQHVTADGTSTYPKTVADFGLPASDSSITLATAPVSVAPSNPQTVEAYTCDDGMGSKIGYWDYQASAMMYAYDGPSSASSDCTLIVQ